MHREAPNKHQTHDKTFPYGSRRNARVHRILLSRTPLLTENPVIAIPKCPSVPVRNMTCSTPVSDGAEEMSEQGAFCDDEMAWTRQTCAPIASRGTLGDQPRAWLMRRRVDAIMTTLCFTKSGAELSSVSASAEHCHAAALVTAQPSLGIYFMRGRRRSPD